MSSAGSQRLALARRMVLGEAARVRLFGLTDPLGRFVKMNQQWFHVIGIAGPQAAAQNDVAGVGRTAGDVGDGAAPPFIGSQVEGGAVLLPAEPSSQ